VPTSSPGRNIGQNATVPKPEDLTDGEWLDTYCEGLLRLLKRTGPYKRDAILYRRIMGLLPNFRKNSKDALQRAKHPDGNGAFYGTLLRLVKASHPSQWYLCGACDGTGVGPAEEGEGKDARPQCSKCWGAAYRLKIEDR
jgi:hypothetical protein